MTQIVRNEYPFFAGYVILQFIALAVAWSILGGYAGYVNFGPTHSSVLASTRRSPVQGDGGAAVVQIAAALSSACCSALASVF
jgi:branched-chain amino acid transport system permease protein